MMALFRVFRSILLVVFFVLNGCGGGSSNSQSSTESGIDPLPEFSGEAGWHEGTLEHNGLARVFRYYVPEGLKENAPTVVLFHGGTQSMDAVFRSNAGGTKAWVPLAEEENFVLLVPNGMDPETGSHTGDNQFWNDCRMPGTVDGPQSMADDVGFIMKLDAWVQSRLSVDPDRFYLTGASNGGQMAYRLAIERAERVAAIATFIANLPVKSECSLSSTPVPVFMMNGTEDPIIPFDGGKADGRGPFFSAPETRDVWVGVNAADTSRRSVMQFPNRSAEDESEVLCADDPAGDSGAPVRFCRVEGGGHSMPSIEYPISSFAERILGPQNQDLEGARLAWQFLQGHHK